MSSGTVPYKPIKLPDIPQLHFKPTLGRVRSLFYGVLARLRLKSYDESERGYLDKRFMRDLEVAEKEYQAVKSMLDQAFQTYQVQLQAHEERESKINSFEQWLEAQTPLIIELQTEIGALKSDLEQILQNPIRFGNISVQTKSLVSLINKESKSKKESLAKLEKDIRDTQVMLQTYKELHEDEERYLESVWPALDKKRGRILKTQIILEEAKTSGMARAMLYASLKRIEAMSDATENVKEDMARLKEAVVEEAARVELNCDIEAEQETFMLEVHKELEHD